MPSTANRASEGSIVRQWLLEDINATPAQFAQFLRDHGIDTSVECRHWEQQFEGLQIYKRLVRHSLKQPVLLALPQLFERMGPLLDEYFERFLRAGGPQRRVLREVTAAFLDYCAPRWPDDLRVPRWAMDLARFEFVQVQLGAERELPNDSPRAGVLTPDSTLKFSRALRMQTYSHAVHRMPDDLSEPDLGCFRVMSFRDRNWHIRHLELTPLAAEILWRLISGASLRNSIKTAAEDHSEGVTDQVLSGCNTVLGALVDAGLVVSVGTQHVDVSMD